jgi:hypothetical protein
MSTRARLIQSAEMKPVYAVTVYSFLDQKGSADRALYLKTFCLAEKEGTR